MPLDIVSFPLWILVDCVVTIRLIPELNTRFSPLLGRDSLKARAKTYFMPFLSLPLA